jgi:hypothetical protein
MKFNKSILFPALALLVIVIIGLVLFRVNRNDEEVATEQVNSTISREELDHNTANGEVLGENTQPRDAEDSTPDPEKVSGGKEVAMPTPQAPAPVATPTQSAPTHQTVRYTSLGFELLTPIGWKHKAEQISSGLVVTFYEGKAVYGTIEGVNGYTSLEQYETYLRSNSAYSNVSKGDFNGMSALHYQSATRPGLNTAVVVKGRLYVFNGPELSKYWGKIKFF